MPRYSDMLPYQPLPGRGGRLSDLSRQELNAYVDQVAPDAALRFGNMARADYPYSMDGQGMRQALGDELQRMDKGMQGQTLDQAAVATAGVPILGDAVGLAADAKAVYDDPSLANIGGAALGALPFVPAMAAIRAYHGSPHDFDKFDMSKIGTGEGNQAYGHGLYFAEVEDTAKSYRDSVSLSKSGNLDWDDPGTVATFWVRNTGSRADAADYLRNIPEKNKSPATNAAIELLESGKPLIEAPSGRMYEVNINAEPDEFLNFDGKLQDQPKAVKDWLEKELGYTITPSMDGGRSMSMALQSVDNRAGRLQRSGFSPELSADLREAGIPGIKYLDQGSRAAGEGSRNYVVFDDALIDIIRKYGIGALLGGSGAFGLMSMQGDDGTQPPL